MQDQNYQMRSAIGDHDSAIVIKTKNRAHIRAGSLLVSLFLLGIGSFVYPQSNPRTPITEHKEQVKMTQAKGTFEVSLKPQDDKSEDATLGRMTIDKQFHGDLEGVSKGQMLTASTTVKDSAGYVAIERITGTLHGRQGSFVLQHNGTMNRGVPQLVVTVVPDSGTDQLAGITGTLTIKITEGKHFYEFEYTLPNKP